MWSKYAICVALFFVLTLKFEALNNVLIVILLLSTKERLKISVAFVFCLALLTLYFIPFYYFYLNEVYIKYILYALRLLILLYLSKAAFDSLSMKKVLNGSIEFIYFVHAGAIMLCYISPQINSFFRSIFSYSTGSEFRISGFIQGYEFVSYIMLIHLAYEFEINDGRLTKSFLVKLLLGALSILFSGRFGLIPLGIIFMFIIFKSFDIFKLLIFILFGVFLSTYFADRFENIKSTSNLVYDILTDVDNIDSQKYYNEIEIDGQYNLSPLTFYYEFLKPFQDWGSHLLPNKSDFVDSGPAFLSLNLGFLATFLLYILFFKAINKSSGIAIPISVVMVVLIVDLKFRSLYTLTPAVWLLLNHVNYIYYKRLE